MTRQLDDLLDRCLERARSGGDPEEVLKDHPEAAGEIRALLPVAARLAALPGPEPSHRRLMATIARALTQQPADAPTPATAFPAAPRLRRRPFLRRVPAAAWAAVAVLAILLAGWGTVGASSHALPGEFLYPVKLLTERVHYAAAIGPESKAELLLTFSDRRLREAVERHRSGGGLDRALLAQMLRYGERALEAAPDVSDDSRSALTERVASCQERQHRALAALARDATPAERQALQPFVDVCKSRCECLRKAAGYCENCSPARPSCEAMKDLLKRFPRLPAQAPGPEHNDLRPEGKPR